MSTCKWLLNELDGSWDTECDEAFWGDISPRDPAINYCPSCGKPIEETQDLGQTSGPFDNAEDLIRDLDGPEGA